MNEARVIRKAGTLRLWRRDAALRAEVTIADSAPKKQNLVNMTNANGGENYGRK
jgi:hypothetical protein